MPISVVMPALEMAQETGKLISWLKKEGESVAKGEPLLEIETDKAVMEIESPGDGVLAGVKAAAGTEVQVGKTIAWILKAGETIPQEAGIDAVEGESGRKFAATPAAAPSATTAAPAAGAGREVKVSPKARRLAKEKGVDLAQVHGSGPGGEILTADIEAAGRARTPVAPVKEGREQGVPATAGESPALQTATRAGAPTPQGTIPAAQDLGPIARLMAERTAQSWTTVPHFFVVRELDATALNEARRTLAPAVEKSDGVKLTHSDLLVALVARVLEKHPRMNSSWTGSGIRANADINICLAMAVSDGVVAPVIHNADRASFGSIAIVRRDLIERARANKLRPTDLTGGTFTISNLGMFDVDAFTAIITPPQAAILAVGRISDRVVAVNGQPTVRPMMTLTLSTDHRVADGARAAEFMRDLASAIADPRSWLGGA